MGGGGEEDGDGFAQRMEGMPRWGIGSCRRHPWLDSDNETPCGQVQDEIRTRVRSILVYREDRGNTTKITEDKEERAPAATTSDVTPVGHKAHVRQTRRSL